MGMKVHSHARRGSARLSSQQSKVVPGPIQASPTRLSRDKERNPVELASGSGLEKQKRKPL
jgi:hypothetical protein